MLRLRNGYMAFKTLILAVIVVNIYYQFTGHTLKEILLLVFIAFIAANEFIRIFKFNKQNKYTYISLFLGIYCSAILEYFVGSLLTTIFIYLFIFEILQLKKDIMKVFFTVNLLLFILAYTVNFAPSNLKIKLMAFITTSILYSAIIIRKEKEEIVQLNERLTSANLKLQEYALQIEEAAIYRERTRVAQELHDSLGHSLMTLAMHLEYVRKICSTKPEKVEEILVQSEKIAKASINDLRKAVDVLKSEPEINDFNLSVKHLINNFYLISNIKINYNYNEYMESLNPVFKTAIYKTIQEAVTNSMKHGGATEINIKTAVTKENVQLVITDNGKGCDQIVMSNGLKGIENRTSLLGGTTNCFSENHLGFAITISIPIQAK